MDSEVSLRPLSLKPGGGKANPFAGFGKGAGAGIKKQVRELPPYEAKPKKPASEIVTYANEFLLKFSERYTKMPAALQAHQDIVLDTREPSQMEQQRKVLQAAAEEVEVDTRDWRARTGGDHAEGMANGGAAPAAPAPQAPPPQQEGLYASPPLLTAQHSGGSPFKAARPQASAPAQPQQQQQAAASKKEQPARTAAPTAAAVAAGVQPANAGPTPQIQRAADVGRQAWAPASVGAGGQASTDKAIKVVKGILNKLTPEKFDRLLVQLIDAINSAEVLHSTIQLTFENAVAQPTFVALYAELCNRLSEALPQFPPAAGNSRPISFRKVLLNTCQEEFEGATAAREAANQAPEAERAAADRRAKQRMLGNIRLIGELFKKGVVPEAITHLCIAELVGDPKSTKDPAEDNVEAVCELLTIAGQSLEAASQKSRERVGTYFGVMDRWQKSKALPSRIRFMVKDVVELRRSKWIPRREQLQAKKLDEIHAEAHAELGMVPATLLPTLETLQPLPRSQRDEVELFPALRGGEDWQSLMKGGSSAGGAGYSALTGEYRPIETAKPKAAPAPTPAAAPTPVPEAASAPAPKPQAGPMSEEQRVKRAKGLFSEYLSAADLKEAVACAQEITTPEFAPDLLKMAFDQLFEVIKPREQEMVQALLVALQKQQILPKPDMLQQGLSEHTQQLEDLSLDIPAAPKLLGELCGLAVAEQVVELSQLPTMMEPVESAEPKRKYVGAALKQIKEKAGADKLKALCASSKVDWEKLLAADPEFDGEMPSVTEFLASESFKDVLSA